MSDEAQLGGSTDLAEWLCVFVVVGVRFVRRTDRCRARRDVDACEDEWASRCPQVQFVVS
jgi:hypothetical protein